MMINLILFLVSTLFKEIGAKGFAEVIRMGVNKKRIKASVILTMLPGLI